MTNRMAFPVFFFLLTLAGFVIASCGGGSDDEGPRGPAKESLEARKLLPADYKAKVNPYAGENASKEVLARGKLVYQGACLTCHDAKGTGAGAGGTMLIPKPSDLASAEAQDAISDQYIFWRTVVGGTPVKTGMTPSPQLSDEDRWKLVAYVRSLGK